MSEKEYPEQIARNEIALSIGLGKTEENIRPSKAARFKRARIFDHYITTDSYVDSSVFDSRLFRSKTIHIINKHAVNAAAYKILVCIDPNDWHVLKAETPLPAATDVVENNIETWAYYKLQVKSNVAVTPADITAYASGATP